MHEIVEQLRTQLKAAWQCRWYGTGVAWLVAIVGWIIVALLPNRYQASARVYVDTQSVLRPLLQGVAVQLNVNQMVTMMSKTLISRPNLEKVIQMADMDINLKTPEDREKLITTLTTDLTIKSAGNENFYTIAYDDRDPKKARRVVQSLLTIFVEGSLGNKRKDTDVARNFINEQLKAQEEKLLAAENAVSEFKRKNMGLMGSEAQTYYVKLGEAQAAMSQAALELKEAENARDAIQQQLKGGAPPSLVDESSVAAEVANPEIDSRIQDLQKKLDGLRLTFTEQHPDIVGLTRMIGQLKEQKEREAKLKKQSLPPRLQTGNQNPFFQQLSVSLAESEARVASMKARATEYERRYGALLAAANSVPKAEAEFTQLTRDYEVYKKNYEALLSRRTSVQLSGDMEANASGMDFRIVDPPQVPTIPSAPNRLLLSSLVLVIALVGGAGIAYLTSQIRPTVTNEFTLRRVSGFPVFGTVVAVWDAAYLAKQKKALIAFALSFLSLLSAYAVIMAILFRMVAKV